MKTLKTKRVNILTCWNGLKNTPPKEFPNIGEMDKASDILDEFKGIVPDFVEIMIEGEKINTDIQLGKINPEEIMAKKAEFQKKANALEDATGEQEVDVLLEDDVFNTFFQQFERWGKNWFQKLDGFLSFRKDLNQANQHPKEEKK